MSVIVRPSRLGANTIGSMSADVVGHGLAKRAGAAVVGVGDVVRLALEFADVGVAAKDPGEAALVGGRVAALGDGRQAVALASAWTSPVVRARLKRSTWSIRPLK